MTELPPDPSTILPNLSAALTSVTPEELQSGQTRWLERRFTTDGVDPNLSKKYGPILGLVHQIVDALDEKPGLTSKEIVLVYQACNHVIGSLLEVAEVRLIKNAVTPNI